LFVIYQHFLFWNTFSPPSFSFTELRSLQAIYQHFLFWNTFSPPSFSFTELRSLQAGYQVLPIEPFTSFQLILLIPGYYLNLPILVSAQVDNVLV
jgi:hypothetical protein